MKKKQTADLRGIVVAGDSRQQAEDHYRAVATGASVKAFADPKHNFVILSNADADLDLINPLSGEMNLVEAGASVTERLEFFKSESSQTSRVETFYTICADGCGSHIIADDPELMHNCPVCASELADLSEEEILSLAEKSKGNESNSNSGVPGDDADDSSEDDGVSDAVIVTASSFEDAVKKFRAVCSGEVPSQILACAENETALVCTASAIKSNFRFSPYTGERVKVLDADGFTVTAGADGEDMEAHWYVCASDDCGAHVISSSEEPVFCPVCASGLIEPENPEAYTAMASDDEDDDDFEDDEDLEDEDEDEEGEDDDSDEDLEDEEGEDDDLDDDNSISVAGVTIGDEDFSAKASSESVNVNLLALASTEGKLDPKKLVVARVGAVNNETRWLAFYDDKPVALARAGDSNQDSSVFESDVFGSLVAASAKENGVHVALKELGFKSITATVDVEDFVANEIKTQVEAQIESVSSGYEKQSNDFSARFYAALATAAEGTNKNFFADVSNPIKGALVTTLSTLGIRNPEKLVAQAFAEHNESYLKGLLKKTREIMQYDVQVQNQLTEAIASASKETEAKTLSTFSIGTAVASNETSAKQHQEKSDRPKLEVVASNLSMDQILSTLRK